MTDLDFNVAAERHVELVLCVLGKDSLKRLFEQGSVERVSHYQVTTRVNHAREHTHTHHVTSDAKKILTASPTENWTRPPSRPRTTWMKTIQQDLKSNNLSMNEAIVVTQNRPLYRLMSMFGVVHTTKEEEECQVIMLTDINSQVIRQIIGLSRSPEIQFRLGMLIRFDFPGSRKNFPFPGKKFLNGRISGNCVQSIATKFRCNST